MGSEMCIRDRWVGGWIIECFRVYGCLTSFVLLFSGPMVVSQLSRQWSAAFELLLYFIYYTAVIHGGWVDRFVGVTFVLLSAVLLQVGE